MIALYVGSCIVRGFVLSWCDTPPQYCERSIWDGVGFYTIYTFLNLLVESQIDSFLMLIIPVNMADLLGCDYAHMCGLVNVGLGLNHLINSKMGKVLTMNLALRESVACWPLTTSMTLFLILSYPPPASLHTGEFPLMP
jgi:hypothetical protein